MAAVDSVTLRVNWSILDEAIVGQYEIRNDGEERLLVFDRLYETERSGERMVRADLAYTTLDDDSVLLIDKFVAALPEAFDIESPELPYARPVEPGESLAGRAVVARPVMLRPPYPQAHDTGRAQMATAVKLRLGYAPIDEKAVPRGIATEDETVYAVRHAWAAPRQRIVESQPKRVDLRIEPSHP